MAIKDGKPPDKPAPLKDGRPPDKPGVLFIVLGDPSSTKAQIENALEEGYKFQFTYRFNTNAYAVYAYGY